MNPRTLLNSLRSPTGALILFLIGLAVVLFSLNRRKRSEPATRTDSVLVAPGSPQLPESVSRDMVPFKVPADAPEPTPTPKGSKSEKPTLPPLSLFAETPVKDMKRFGSKYAPFGRLISCQLVVTVDSSSIQTPIIGLVTEDIYHHGELIIPAGTEVHGSASVDRTRERIASDGNWTLVWQTGEELNLSGIALDQEREDMGWGITDGSAGLRGRLIKSDKLAEIRIYAAALLSGAAEAFTEKRTSDFGSFALPSLSNAPLSGAQSVLDRYAQQIMDSIERDGFYVRVPAGKEFYLYVTQTLDGDDATVGGHTSVEVAEANANTRLSEPRRRPARSGTPSPNVQINTTRNARSLQ